MKNPHPSKTYYSILCEKNINIDSRLLDFRSHKEKILEPILNAEEERLRCEMELKSLIHEWLDYEHKLNHEEPSLNISKLFVYQSNNEIKNENNNEKEENILLENNPLSVELVEKLYKNHSIFKKINYNLAETLINIGVFSLYKKNETIPYVFYSEKGKIKSTEKKRLGFIIYGKFKLIDKANNYEKIIDQNDSIGEHGIESFFINFTDYRDIDVKCFTDESAVLWIAKSHYEILFKESMRCGLKEELRKLESHLKISWINKSLKKF